VGPLARRPETYGGAYPGRVASVTVSDPDARKTAEIDVGRLRPATAATGTRYLAIGEAKCAGKHDYRAT